MEPFEQNDVPTLPTGQAEEPVQATLSDLITERSSACHPAAAERGVVVIDSQKIIAFVDDAAAELLGGPKESFVGKPCAAVTNLLPCATATCHLPLPCPLLSAGEDQRDAPQIKPAVRSNNLCSFHSQAIVNRAGAPIGIIHLVTLPEPPAPYPIPTGDFHGIIGAHPSMKKLFELIALVAVTDVTTHIFGPTGVGKELVADAIHAMSARSGKRLVKLNCSTIPPTLLESTLFGHAKGSFTGAIKEAEGFVEHAHGGTLFLDEIGDISHEVQVKLLRLLESRTFSRVGETRVRRADIRIVTATNQDLRKLVTSGKMREDFFYRINVFPLTVPPLRERGDDILLLAHHFIELFNGQLNRSVTGLSTAAITALRHYSWPGNVRELRHAIEHAFVHVMNGKLLPEHFPPLSPFEAPQSVANHDLVEPSQTASRVIESPGGLPPLLYSDLDDTRGRASAAAHRPPLTKELLERALRNSGGNASEAARRCGVSRVTLWKYMKRFGITRTG